MKKTRKILLGLFGAFLVAGFMGCDSGTDGSNAGNVSIGDLQPKTTNVKSLFVSDIPTSGSGKAVFGNSIQTLSYISETGQIVPFQFAAPSGKNFVLNIRQDGVRQLDPMRIVANFDSYNEITESKTNTVSVYTVGETINNIDGRALIDMKNSKVYDFKGYSPLLVSGNLVFAYKNTNATVYKINLDNISAAIPVNNREYFPCAMGRLTPPALFENKIIFASPSIYDYYSFDVNNALPPQRIKDAQITSDMCSFVPEVNPFIVKFYANGSGSTGHFLQDLSGTAWFFVTGGATPGLSSDSITNYGESKKYFIGKISIDNAGQFSLSDSFEDIFTFEPDSSIRGMYLLNSENTGKRGSVGDPLYYSGSIMLVYKNGFVILKKKVDGIQVDSTALLIPENVKKNVSFVKSNYLYYLEETAIKRLHLVSGSSPETIYSNNKMVTIASGTTLPLEISGNDLIFYQFAEDNITVNTYSLSINKLNEPPILLASSMVEVENIVELDF
jgi:hypothetical protein